MNAPVSIGPALTQSPRGQTVVDEAGGLYITREQLEAFGGGDAQQGRRDLRLFLAASRARPTAQNAGKTIFPKNVRFATEADEAGLLELLRIDIQENAEAVAPMDDDRVMQNLLVGTRFRNGFVGVIDGSNGDPIALTVIHPIQWWWSQQWYFGEVVNFVHPDHRKGRLRDDLINFGRWVSDEQTRQFGYRVYFLCGVLGTKRLRSKQAMYGRKFDQVGAAFLYPSPPGGVTA